MNIEIGFGNTPQFVEIPDANVLDILIPNPLELNVIAEEVLNSIKNTVGTATIDKLFKTNDKIVIITNDTP